MARTGSLGVQVRLFLDFCRMEKGLAQNSIAAYARDLERYSLYSRASYDLTDSVTASCTQPLLTPC